MDPDDDPPQSSKNGEVSTTRSVLVENGYHHRVVGPDMCIYCFDVLVAYLTGGQSPRSPHFTNDEL